MSWRRPKPSSTGAPRTVRLPDEARPGQPEPDYRGPGQSPLPLRQAECGQGSAPVPGPGRFARGVESPSGDIGIDLGLTHAEALQDLSPNLRNILRRVGPPAAAV